MAPVYRRSAPTFHFLALGHNTNMVASCSCTVRWYKFQMMGFRLCVVRIFKYCAAQLFLPHSCVGSEGLVVDFAAVFPNPHARISGVIYFLISQRNRGVPCYLLMLMPPGLFGRSFNDERVVGRKIRVEAEHLLCGFTVEMDDSGMHDRHDWIARSLGETDGFESLTVYLDYETVSIAQFKQVTSPPFWRHFFRNGSLFLLARSYSTINYIRS